MPATATQQKRLLSVDTPLGKDKLLLNYFSGRDGISQLFRFRLNLLSEDAAIDPSPLIAKNVTVSMELAGGKTRYFNGIVNRFTVGGKSFRSTVTGRSLWQYQAEVVPWLWMLTQTSDCRIFQD